MGRKHTVLSRCLVLAGGLLEGRWGGGSAGGEGSVKSVVSCSMCVCVGGFLLHFYAIVWTRNKIRAQINTMDLINSNAMSFYSPVSFVEHEFGSRETDALNLTQLRHLLSENRRGQWNRQVELGHYHYHCCHYYYDYYISIITCQQHSKSDDSRTFSA